jgi:DNA-binding NtrC family response regulator
VLDDQSVQNVMAAALQRIGFGVDIAPDAEQGARSLERDSYTLVATERNGNSNGEGLYNRIITFAPEVRRNLFLVLVGNDLNSGDGMQAFSAMVDLVLSPKDIGASDELLQNTMHERTRLYQTFLDAQVRVDAQKY